MSTKRDWSGLLILFALAAAVAALYLFVVGLSSHQLTVMIGNIILAIILVILAIAAWDLY